MCAPKHLIKYFISKSESEENLAEADVIRANRLLNNVLGGVVMQPLNKHLFFFFFVLTMF